MRTAFGLVLSLIISSASLVAAAEGRALPEPAEEIFHQDVAWSPDGARIAFSALAGGSDYDPKGWGIWVVELDGGAPEQVLADAQWVSWSPDGDRLAVSASRNGNRDVYLVRPDGSGLERLTAHPAADRAPVWSPDGRRIAFSSDRSGNADLWVTSLEGGQPVRITSHPAAEHNPSWSPDGAEIVFYRELGEARDQIVAVAADGGRERAITDDDYLNTFPTVLPDGRISFSSMQGRDGRKGLVRVEPDGSGRVEIGPPGAFFGRWSPDGTRLAFVAGSWPRSAIYLLSVDDGRVEKLVN